MDEFDWIINGLQPFNIESVDDTSFPKITLHCVAHIDDIRYETPLDEIKAFKALASLEVTTEPTTTGGIDVQTSIDGELIPISNGDDNYFAALYYPQYNPDALARTLIEFDLVLELQIVNKDIIPDAPTDPTNQKPYNLITTGYQYKIKTTRRCYKIFRNIYF